MKKLIKEEKFSKPSIISRLTKHKEFYNIVFDRLNAVIEQQIKETGTNAKTYLPKNLKNKL